MNDNIKLGGPDCSFEKEKRQSKVYELHFEKSMSARKIAQHLGKNRNTINEDIKHFNQQLSKEISEVDYLASFMKQVSRLEDSRYRLIEDLEKQEKTKDKLAIEKQIFAIDGKLSVLYEKVPRLQHFHDIPTISEEQVKEFTRDLVLNNTQIEYDVSEMSQMIMDYHKCDVEFAREFDAAMHKLGLGRCGDDLDYDMFRFAKVRLFLSDSEIKRIEKIMKKLHEKRLDDTIKDIKVK
ncbi:hypothetical protein [Nitrosopumilus sp.]|uniref:hypothetical protein n=1 Tax=Nitrosopumilus sp. TaxID=2024843 RepID=UPI00247EE91A|nr:hypothetical protein [Nitrosopumilus sp.]MCV0430643.1 hypothetical protein [Nitrosopumilus sp.]